MGLSVTRHRGQGRPEQRCSVPTGISGHVTGFSVQLAIADWNPASNFLVATWLRLRFRLKLLRQFRSSTGTVDLAHKCAFARKIRTAEAK